MLMASSSGRGGGNGRGRVDAVAEGSKASARLKDLLGDVQAGDTGRAEHSSLRQAIYIYAEAGNIYIYDALH